MNFKERLMSVCDEMERAGDSDEKREGAGGVGAGGTASNHTLINGRSINQWKIIKSKQCDLFPHLPRT